MSNSVGGEEEEEEVELPTSPFVTHRSQWNSYRSAPCSISRQAFQDACDSETSCKAFDWSPNHKDCFLITTPCTSATTHGEGNSYWKPCEYMTSFYQQGDEFHPLPRCNAGWEQSGWSDRWGGGGAAMCQRGNCP